MTTNKAAAALLSDIHTIYCTASAVRLRGWTAHQMAHQVEGMVEDHLADIIAEATAQQAAEVARLREALDGLVKAVAFQNSAWGSVPGQAQADFAVREAQAIARAALAAAPAVAPDPAQPAPDERCEDCAGNFVDGYCRRHEPSFHGYNGAVSVPEPAP